MQIASPLITSELIASALTYEQYVQLSTDLFAQGRTTSDDPHYNTPEILGYTKLNLHRMSRLNRLTVVSDELKTALAQLSEPWIWLVLTESWCGDAAQLVPVLHRIAGESDRIHLRFLLRDKNPGLMNDYLTNGGRSIPKLICLHEIPLARPAYEEIGTWGPRPAGLQAHMQTWKTEQLPLSEAVERAQRWYNEDHTQSTQAELLAAITSWSKISV
ncbi:hypothetical protein GGR92_000154 [Spirosoma lacussanchae]|uniref:thioredoxin family protein n=1 Tax=Spirosoma lacussanchae TaxID=1884249 RepID=UPI00110920DC|nr:thioredoxin family protein [Spirosoma lacussanchae]